MHQAARCDGLVRAAKRNLDYLGENCYRLFAVDCDIERFVSLVDECTEYLLPQDGFPDVPYPSWLIPKTDEKVRPALNVRVEFGPREKEMLAAGYASLLGVAPTDLFDAQWRVRFNEEYFAACLRERGVLTDE